MKAKLTLIVLVLFVCIFITAGLGQIVEPPIVVTNANQDQSYPQSVSNFNNDQYIVVWEDYRDGGSDVYARLFEADGTPLAQSFPICNLSGNQYLPHVDYDPYNDRYLIVFKDNRFNPEGEMYAIYGCLLTSDGNKIPVKHSEADTTFRISFNTGGTANWPSVAFNHIDKRYLVVWSERMEEDTPPEIKGQLLDENGDILIRADLTKASMPTDNFWITENPLYMYDVTDVTWNYMVNEWLVVFAKQAADMMIWDTYVVAQRVDSKGMLIKQDGTEGMEAIDCSGITGNGTSCSWPSVQANYEFLGEEEGVLMEKPGMLPMPICESLVGWRTYHMETYADIWAQRIAYYTDEDAVEFGWKEGPAEPGLYFAAYYSADAVADDDSLMSFPISNVVGDQNHFDLGYSALDNEFACGWGDLRNTEGWRDQDLYLQLMPVWEGDSLKLTDLTHQTIITSFENIPVIVEKDIFDGSSLYTGLAHSAQQNQFLLAYVHASDPEDASTRDVHAVLIEGLNEWVIEPTVLTGLTEDFDDGALSPFWVPEDGGGFVLNEADGALQIDMAKERGFAAVKFVPAPFFILDMSANPYVSVKVKASADVKLQIGATNEDQAGNPNAVPPLGPNEGNHNIIGGNDWVVLAFDFSGVFAENGTTGDRVSTVFFNFNPGNAGTDPTEKFLWEGTIWFDDLKFGADADLTTLDVASVSGLPEKFALMQNYPNPFNPSTQIQIALPFADHVVCTIFDIQGRKVRTLTNEHFQAGYHDLIWDSRNDVGHKVTSGVYVYQVKTTNELTSKKMILMR